jgi:glucose/arabinose dehydrogenase
VRRWGILAGVGVVAATLAFPISAAGAADLNTVHVGLTPVATKLKEPVALAWRAGDTQMYVAEQRGRLRTVITPKRNRNVLNVKASSGGERGLLGVTFTASGTKVIVDYTDRSGTTKVDEYRMNGRKAIKKSRRQILSVAQPFANHNGGEVTFGPDGMLYVGLGDGGGGGDPQGNGQRLDTLLGKILRINPVQNIYAGYSVPASNPFVGVPGARGEIWMYGLRNPWRFSFDQLTGDAWIGDVGQSAWEEVDYAPAGDSGINWGWNRREGAHPYTGTAPAGARDPILERSHATGDCAITGGYVYRGTKIPKLQGAYVYGDYCTGVIYAAVQSGGVITQSTALGIKVPNLTSFGQDPSGELYAVAGSAGVVYKLIP